MLDPKEEIEDLCLRYAELIKAPFLKDKPLFLFCLSGVESSFGRNNKPRVEPYYSPGGIYYQKSTLLRSLVDKYGPDASSSFGPWQILFCTAYELGFTGKPIDLQSAEESVAWVIDLLNKKMIERNPASMDELLLCYNRGKFSGYSTETDPYVKKFHKFYDPLKK